MKAGIVGIGAVGAAVAMAMVLRGSARELVLVNRNRARAKGVATDIRYGVPLLKPMQIADGDYSDLAGAAVVILTAGVNEKAGGATDRSDRAGRLRLLGPNTEVFRDVVPRIVGAAPDAVIIIVTDPPEPLVDVTRAFAGHERVMSTGTYIDSLRFRVHLAERLSVNPASVGAYVIGEHGTSSVFLWSSANIAGVKVTDILLQRGIPFDQFRETIEKTVRYANISIIEGIGASQYGIGIVTARAAEAVLNDERIILPVSSYSKRYGVTLAIPSIVGRAGVSDVFWPELSEDESLGVEHSAEILRKAVSSYMSKFE